MLFATPLTYPSLNKVQSCYGLELFSILVPCLSTELSIICASYITYQHLPINFPPFFSGNTSLFRECKILPFKIGSYSPQSGIIASVILFLIVNYYKNLSSPFSNVLEMSAFTTDNLNCLLWVN